VKAAAQNILLLSVRNKGAKKRVEKYRKKKHCLYSAECTAHSHGTSSAFFS
jgi:hypothetical protein